MAGVRLRVRCAQVLVFALVSSIVERMGDLVHPHAESILSWVPGVWQNGEGQGLLRMQARPLPLPATLPCP